ncbi:sugar phosphate isomerase/epimerase family protein [Streptomyces sp. NPDC001389]|uniref:sugar phosphate isomerase/epimerase family protein n=1 Tax=Streptomyces sp. NPDC001389 TaxID=3364569 RepID=UPI0036B8F67F
MNDATSTLVLNPDELGEDPRHGMDLAVSLGITELEMRTAYGSNLLMLDDEQIRRIRTEADARGLRVAALASPLWKWCAPQGTPARVDSFGFPTRVPAEDRMRWVERALAVAEILGTSRVRVFSHLRVEPDLTEDFETDPLVSQALEKAKAVGVRLLLENEPVCTVAEPAALLRVLRQHEGLGLWLDLGNLHEVGAATAKTVGELAPFAEYVHIKDFRMDGSVRTFCPAGSGHVPYGPMLDVLGAAWPGLPYALETHVRDTPAAAIRQGAGYLRCAGLGV